MMISEPRFSSAPVAVAGPVAGTVRKGMERIGGAAGVESAPGQGSRFWIELPKAEASR